MQSRQEELKALPLFVMVKKKGSRYKGSYNHNAEGHVCIEMIGKLSESGNKHKRQQKDA